MALNRNDNKRLKTVVGEMYCPLCRYNSMGDKVIHAGVWVRRCKACGFEKNFTPKEKR